LKVLVASPVGVFLQSGAEKPRVTESTDPVISKISLPGKS